MLVEIQRGFEQIAIQVRVGGQLVYPSPHQRRGPAAGRERPVVLDRRRLPPLAARFERFRLLQPPHAVLCRPVARWRDAYPPRVGIQWSELDTLAFLIRLASVEYRSFQPD